MNFHGMKDGETRSVRTAAGDHHVTYRSQQSYGDNGQPVRGATTGTFDVQHPDGTSQSFYHGPHATTQQAAKRGANPNAQGYAASSAFDSVTSKASKAQMSQAMAGAGMSGVYQDKRRGAPTASHGSGDIISGRVDPDDPPRPDSDSGTCRDCGRRVSWHGDNRWVHI